MLNRKFDPTVCREKLVKILCLHPLDLIPSWLVMRLLYHTVEQARAATSWGVVLGTLGRQGNPAILQVRQNICDVHCASIQLAIRRHYGRNCVELSIVHGDLNTYQRESQVLFVDNPVLFLDQLCDLLGWSSFSPTYYTCCWKFMHPSGKICSMTALRKRWTFYLGVKTQVSLRR